MATGVIINQTVDPSAGAGKAAGIGSILLRDNAGVGETWQKTGAADTAWALVGTGGGAPTDATYLVTAAHAGLSAEIVVGATPGGELGGTWGSPTVDATHSGSSHAGLSGQPGSTDVAVADGGTGASTAAAARTNLGLGTAAVQADTDYLRVGQGANTGFRSGLYYGPHGWVTATSSPVLSRLYAFPFHVGRSTAFDRMILATTGAATSLCRLGLYSDTGGKPDALIVDAGTVSCAVGGDIVATIAQTLTGTVWIAAVMQTATAPVIGYVAHLSPMTGVAVMYGSSNGFGYYIDGVTGGLPSPWGATINPVVAAPAPAIRLRAT